MHITSVGTLNVCNLWILLRKIVVYLVGTQFTLTLIILSKTKPKLFVSHATSPFSLLKVPNEMPEVGSFV